MSDLTPDIVKRLNLSGWTCNQYPGLCTIPQLHINQPYVHRLVYDPARRNQILNLEFEGNALVMHVGKYRGRVRERGDDLIIPSGRFLFFTTEEIVDLPFDIDGNLFMNPRVSNLGLQFFTLGHVDPGFHGHLTATILNTTDNDIVLDRHDGILYFVLSRMDAPMAPNFKTDFHLFPQDTIAKAQDNLSYNTRTAFALTSEKFVTRRELYELVLLILALLAVVFAMLQYFSNPLKTIL